MIWTQQLKVVDRPTKCSEFWLSAPEAVVSVPYKVLNLFVSDFYNFLNLGGFLLAPTIVSTPSSTAWSGEGSGLLQLPLIFEIFREIFEIFQMYQNINWDFWDISKRCYIITYNMKLIFVAPGQFRLHSCQSLSAILRR